MENRIEARELLSLEEYEAQRGDIRAKAIAIKKDRKVAIGEHVTLLFENRETIFYQVMEMLRIEKTTSEEGIAEELSAYNPLIPDGSNFKATMLIEYEDPVERDVQLKYLKGIEHKVYLKIGDFVPVFAVADEDMDRSDEEKTSAVHFLRFELDGNRVSAFLNGEPARFGCEHPNYGYDSGELDTATRQSLSADLARH